MTDVDGLAGAGPAHGARSASSAGAMPLLAHRHVQFGLVAFGVALNVILVFCVLLGDPDTHWHVAVGRWIVENGGWPDVDLFSHTFAGQPWIAKEWLSQVALHGAYVAAGWTGVALLGAVAIAASLGMLAAWLSRRVNALAAFSLVVLVFLLSSSSLPARPHILALPLMLAWVLGLLGAVERRQAPSWLLIPLMLLWSNAHAGYTIGFAIAGLLALEAVRDAGSGRQAAMATRWGLFLALAFAASCLTPYGYEALLVTKKLFAGGGREAIAHIEEWRSIKPDLPGVIGMILLPSLLIGLCLQPWRNVVRIALVLILGWMMIRHARFGLLFAFTALPIAVGAIANGALARRFAPRGPGAGVRPGLLPAFAAISIILALVSAPSLRTSPDTTPTEALDAARKLGLMERNVYNTYNFGGFLINQGVPTFIDGRTDQLFLDGFFDAYVRTRDPGAGAELSAYLERHKVGWAIVRTGSPEALSLSALGWISRHADAVATILVPPSP